MRRPVFVVALMAMSIAACSDGDGDGDAAEPTPTEPSSSAPAAPDLDAAGGWTSRAITAASDLLAAGDVVVVVDVSDGSLEAVALDARTGRERWRRPTTPSGQFGGSGVGGPAAVGDVVVLLEPGSDRDFVVGRSAADGKERWRAPVQATFEPVRCGSLVCTAETSLAGDERVVARDPATGDERWSSTGDTDAVLSDDRDRVDLLLGDDPSLRAVDPATGKPRWTRPLPPAFGFPANTAGGWSFDRSGTDLVGYVGPYEDEEGGGPATRGAVVAVDLASGVTRWVRADLGKCWLPVRSAVLLCGEQAGIERVDPASGTTTWKLDRSLGGEEPGPYAGFSSDESKLYLREGTDSWVAVDTASGAVAEPAADAVAWMVRFRSLEVKVGSSQPEEYLHSYEPVPFDLAEDAGVRSPSVSAAAVPAGVGVSAGGMRIYLDASGRVHAVRA